MAIYFRDEPDTGAELGRGLTTGLASGLQQLLSSRMKEMEKRGISSGLEALGYSPLKAQQLRGLPTPILQQLVKQLPKGEQRSFLQSQGLPPEIADFAPQAQKAFIQQLLPQVQEGQIQQLLGPGLPGQSNILPQQKEQNSALLAQQQGIDLPEDSNVELAPSDPQEIARLQESQNSFQIPVSYSSPESKREIKDFANAKPLGYELAPGAKALRETQAIDKKLENPNLTPAQRVALKKQKEHVQEKADKKQDTINKRVDPFRQKTNDLAKGAEENNLILDKMLNLINNDGVAGPLTNSALNLLKEGVSIFGFPLSANIDLFGRLSAGTQEFKKLSATLIKGIRTIFDKGQITTQELHAFLDTIPNLQQSDEGKRRVIRQMRLLNQGLIVRKKAQDEILDQNDGYAPHNLEDLVFKASKADLDKIGREFVKGYESPQELARQYRVRKRGLVGLPISVLEDFAEGFKV